MKKYGRRILLAQAKIDRKLTRLMNRHPIRGLALMALVWGFAPVVYTLGHDDLSGSLTLSFVPLMVWSLEAIRLVRYRRARRRALAGPFAYLWRVQEELCEGGSR